MTNTKIISVFLVLALLLSISSCITSDDVLSDEDQSQSDVFQNIEAATNTPATEKTTEENKKAEDKNEIVVYQEKIITHELITNFDSIPDDALSFIRKMLGIDEWIGDEKTVYELERTVVNNPISVKSVYGYDVDSDLYDFYLVWEDLDEIVNFDGYVCSVFKNAFIIDGADIDESKCDSLYLLIQAIDGGGYPYIRKMNSVDFSDGMLSLGFCAESINEGDDYLGRSVVLIELDKSEVNAENLKSLKISMELECFDVAATNLKTGRRVECPGWHSWHMISFLLGDNMAWTAGSADCDFDVEIEFLEKEIVGYEKGDKYKPIYEPDGNRVIKYNFALGICVEGDRVLTLTEEQRKLFNSMIHI